MRKALIGLFMAATAMTPAAAWAQDEDGGRAERIQQRMEQRQQARSERQVQRAEPAQARSQRQEQRIERQQQIEPAQPRDFGGRRERAQVRHAEPRHVDSAPASQAWQGDPNDPRRRHYERLERRNQERHGTQAAGHGDGGHRGDHRDLHRDLRGDHRELHRSDPSRREHREWHRDARQDHRDAHRDSHRDVHRDYRDEHRDLHRSDPTRREHRQFHREVNRDHRQFHREWDRGWRRDRRYDWSSWRYRNRDLFQSRYYSPYRQHRYSRFSIGLFLEPLFYSQRYWIDDPWQYRLPPAPPGTQWVRYYNDVLLVDTWSGEVIDVIYDFFW